MNDGATLESSPYLYDAIVLHIDSGRGIITFAAGEATHRVKSDHVDSFSQGAVGRLRLPTERSSFVFQTYADQRLRRATDMDNVRENRWGWRIGERRFSVKGGLLPGHNGSVVATDIEEMSILLPREFLDYCGQRTIEPVTLLRTFIADLCSLSSPFERPREDGYSNSGTRACELARAYIQGALGDADDSRTDEPLLGKRRRRRRAKLSTTSANTKGDPSAGNVTNESGKKATTAPSAV